MNFVRESEGIYKYGKKRVFMKIEKDHIILRVGGGYLTIDEFVEQYYDEMDKHRVYNWIYSGNCKGNSQFKTFYFDKEDAQTPKTED